MNMLFSRHWLVCLAIVLLLVALAPLPFTYYQLMNWVVVGACVTTAMTAHAHKKTALVWMLIAIAVVFNPVEPIHFGANVWKALDVVAAVLLALSVTFVWKKK